MGRLNIGDIEVQNVVGVIELRFLRRGKNEPGTRAVEKCDIGAGLEKKFEAERVAIKGHGRVETFEDEGDLPDFFKGNGHASVMPVKRAEYTEKVCRVKIAYLELSFSA